MHNRDSDRPPSRPLNVSATSAQQHLAYWLRENNLTSAQDIDGLTWEITIQSETRPSASDPHGGDVHISILTNAKVTAQDLVATKTLNEETDARLVELIGDAVIPLHMRPVMHVAKNLEEARLYLSQAVPGIRSALTGANLPVIKRQLVGKWLDRHQVFGFKSQ